MHVPGDLAVARTSLDRADAMKSNVLLLCVDDMNDWAGCLGGYPGVSTPNIDRLADRGTLFTNAHCPSSVPTHR